MRFHWSYFFIFISFVFNDSFANTSNLDLFSKAITLYNQGNYKETIDELNRIYDRVSVYAIPDSKKLGLIYYWKGMANNRIQEFKEAKDNFEKALKINYGPEDLRYELAQAYFALDKLESSRIHFSESFKRPFKRAQSLYYMAYIAKELGELDNAITLFEDLKKLPAEEAQQVRQAAQMQLGDIALQKAEKSPKIFAAVEKDVIPLYEAAYEMNPESPLAPKIKEKITDLQRKYELVLFQLRNGRPTVIPPYFLRLAQEIALDTNVTFAPTETTIAKSKQESVFSKTEALGRYTYYIKNFLSISPEFRFTGNYYFNRTPEIYRNDNYLLAPAIRTAYEHSLWGNPASVLLDYDYNYAERDVNAEKNLKFNSKSHTFMIGERFKIFNAGETVLRVRRRFFESYLDVSNSKMISFALEQIISMDKSTLLLTGSYDRTRVNTAAFSTDAFNLRGDLILPTFRDWFNPSFGLSLTSTDPINDRDNRGRELMVNPSMLLSKTLTKKLKLNGRIDHQINNSKDKENFAFKKTITGLELEYLF